MKIIINQNNHGFLEHPIWRSAFRPFYLLGVLYGLGVMGIWLVVSFGGLDVFLSLYSLSLWHGHEMVFGFSGAIVVGFLLTALPGWAGTKEIVGGPLVLLVGLWLLGRIAVSTAVFGGSILPALWVMVMDSSLYLVTMIMLLPGLLRAENKHYLALLPILFLLFLGNIIFYLSLMNGDIERASWAIQMGLMGIVVKFILAGGFLAFTFTSNALRQKTGQELVANPLMEYISAISLAGFIYAVLWSESESLSAGIALVTASIQLLRILRWRTWVILDAPLVVTMHLAYLWFILALILYGVAPFVDGIGSGAWLHAFTVGALSMMMLSLITRVSLRHTGRSLGQAKSMIAAFALMSVAAILRLLIFLEFVSADYLGLNVVIWSLSFVLFLTLHFFYLIRPSLPKVKRPKGRAPEIG